MPRAGNRLFSAGATSAAATALVKLDVFFTARSLKPLRGLPALAAGDAHTP